VEPRKTTASHEPKLSGDASTSAKSSLWRRWLSGGTPREILARIVHDDPLHVRERVALALRARRLLLDADRVQLRALAHVARAAVSYRGRPELVDWIDVQVTRAIDDLLAADEHADQVASSSDADFSAGFAALARPLGLEPAQMRRACSAFNRLPEPERRAFFELVIDGRSLDELARNGRESATEIARCARRALETILSRSAPHSVDPTGA
jgi:hypothetical protein